MHCELLSVTIFLYTICVFAASIPRSPIADDEINKALNDTRYLTRQIKCTLGEVRCDPVGKRLKSLAPLVLRGSCPQCTPQEMKQVQKVLAYVQQHYPKEWNKIIQTYGSG
ncbi:hypothetical protein RI129_000871 [Pyrocoelia pectoralis]|uniref:Uncharacterized protein n=1 Tax=Pyrocoelia pectoralis TaxID=417401 RepID=A0AAN7VJR6_9COLE